MTTRLLFVLAALFTLPVNAAEKREEVVEYTLDFTPGNTLSVHAHNGEITLETGASDQVFVRAVKKVKAGSAKDAEELLKTTTIDIAETDSGIEIRTQRPKNQWTPLRPDNKWVPFWNISVNYTITVPSKRASESRNDQREYCYPPDHGRYKKQNLEWQYQNEWHARFSQRTNREWQNQSHRNNRRCTRQNREWQH